MRIKIKKFKSVKSTNETAMKLIKSNQKSPTLIYSENQTKGKGTMGKKWISKKGNLFISIFFEINQKKINFKQFAVLNALILKKIISNLSIKEVKIKWPNDLLYNKKKFCGILQELIVLDKKNFLIIGIGLNTNIAPVNKNFSSTSLKKIMNKRIDNDKILKNIKEKYENILSELKRLSFSELRKKYDLK